MKIIGLTGKAGAGKNFVGELIQAQYGYGHNGYSVTLAAFANPLKDTVAAMFGIDRKLMDTAEGKASKTWYARAGFPTDCNFSVRQLLQLIGTDLVRDCWDEDFWLRRAERDMKSSGADIYVFTDVRFSNEAEMIKFHHGQIWEVTGRQTDGVPAHSSEQQTIQPDAVIYNRPGTDAEQLVGEIKRLMGAWG